MNEFAWFILVALLAGYLLELTAQVLNLRALRSEPPMELVDVVDGVAYARTQAYAKAKAGLAQVASFVDLVALLLFWFLGGFNRLDQWVRGFGFGEIGAGLLFIGALLLLSKLLSLPFSLYNTFVVEERFGFNRTTFRTYVKDFVKVLLLTLVLGGPLLAGVLLFFQKTGADAWLYCWGFVTGFMLLMQFIAPVWLLPLFNKFTPLADGELKEAVLAYARGASFPVSGLFEVDGSQRSSKANAFFAGFGRNRRIGLYDTLIQNHTTAELVAVVAHEVGHYKKHHIIKGTLLGIAHMGVLFYLLSLAISHAGLYAAFAMEQPSLYAGLVFFMLLYTPVELVLGPVTNWYSRKNEYEADRFAAESVGDATPLISALKRLAVESLTNLTPHSFYVALNHSHPPVVERIRAMQRLSYG